jgi:hypothetical protein
MPTVSEVQGVPTIKADMIGELVLVPEPLREEAELIVGEMNMGLFPLGIDVELDKPNDHLNGLWVQREILNCISLTAKAAS